MTDSTEKLTAIQEADVFLRRRYGPAGDDAIRTNAEARAIHDVACAAVAEMTGGAGTSAYEMVAAVETQHLEVTETLIHMVAATVLSLGVDPTNQHQVFGQPDGSYAVTISPKDMDEMLLRYDMNAKRDGMLTVVRIVAKPDPLQDPPTSMYVREGDDPAIQAKPQVETHDYDRPVWAMRRNGELFACINRVNAENRVIVADRDGYVATVENRFCLHADCPAEHCNHEVTSSD